ncbi:MAG: hypothetical protein B1H03_02950 [Planctomycetales bacterium 4484_113]|nr:MAG: hypothetical protein B1H03_02950 [Planctomycetales bacterium 4484_113]
MIAGAIFAAPALAQGLTVEDFRPAIPSRVRHSYDLSLSRYPGQRMLLYWDKKFDYKIYSYIYTRQMIIDHIQTTIDKYALSDASQIENLINYYLDVTPQEREAIAVLYFEAPKISNRYFLNEFVDFEDSVFLEYGAPKVEKHVLRARKQMAKERRDYPTKDEMVYEAGKHPLFLDLDSDYLYYPEKVMLEDQTWDPMNDAYRWVIAFKFSDEDIARLEEFLLNDIDVTFSLVLSRPEMFEYKALPKLQQYQILRMVDPEFIDFEESIDEMSPPKDHTKAKEKYWLK